MSSMEKGQITTVHIAVADQTTEGIQTLDNRFRFRTEITLPQRQVLGLQ